MNSAWAKVVATYRRLPPSTTALLVIVVAVLAGNFMYVTGLASDNPIAWTANISHYLCRVACGRPAIDPNLGYLTQPLGHLAASNLLHGHLPFWNYFEGLGQPLAGEMQSAALFPLTLLFIFSNGLLWFHISLELIAGVSTYFLARRLSIPSKFAVGVAILFALNGTFAWLGNAVLNPVAFLPMLVLGIEMIFEKTQSPSKKGWYVAAFAVALSMYAGFPEVAYIDGVFAFGWAVVRLFDLPTKVRLVFARRVAIAGVAGMALSLPIVVPFYDFYKVAFIGNHVASLDGQSVLLGHASSMLMDPYVYGNIFTNKNAYPFWGGIGGYFGASVVALALLGLFGARLRPLRLYLAAWTVASLLGVFNILHARAVWNLIPLVKTMAFSRYVMPSCELAMIVLAGFALCDFVENLRSRRFYFTVTTVVALLLVSWSAVEASSVNKGIVLTPKTRIIDMGLDAIPFIALGAFLVLGRFWKFRFTPLLIVIVLVGESFLLYFVPTAEAPKSIQVDQAPIAFLLANEGQDRFLDFGVLNANWGTQYGLNSLSAIDLPFPNAFANLLLHSLYPALTPLNQFVIHSGIQGIKGQENAVLANFDAYQAASVKYLVIPQRIVLLPGLTLKGVKLVFQDAIAAIYEMPQPRHFFSTTSPTCTVTSTVVSSASVNCPSGGASLIRTELSMDGWVATVNGAVTPITTLDGVYQSVPVPQGRSTVTFAFTPPHETYAYIGAALALLFLLGAWINERRRRPRHRASE